jgi:hypothetical protein
MAITLEKNISNLLESQFPELYREEGERFIAFVQAYYEWMESQNQVLYHSRRLTEYRDIDKTVDDFIIDFKNKYLPNVQFNTATNKQLFIKNALDFYRAKGTERAVDLFFKLIYGLEARVYYPGDDLFKLSDNTWLNTRYLELKPDKNNVQFVGQQIFGSVSGATAFAERLTRVKKDNQYIEVLYIVDITRDFKTGERIRTQGLDTDYSARIDGSLTSFEITFSTAGFEAGESVYVSDGQGKKAKAVVSKTADYIGVVNFQIIDGGWGYSSDAQIIGSERVLQLDNITFNDNKYFYNHDPSYVFESLVQDLITVKIDITNTVLSDAVFDLENNIPIYAYTDDDPANTQIFEGRLVYKDDNSNIIVLNYTDENYRDANNDLTIPLIGNTITTFYTSDDTPIPVNITDSSGIVDATAQANVIAWDDRFTIEYTQADNFVLRDGDILYQEEPTYFTRYCKLVVANTFANAVSGQTYANVIRDVGWPRNNQPLYKTISENDQTSFDHGGPPNEERLKFGIADVSNVLCGVIGVDGEITNDAYLFNFANTYSANTDLVVEKIDQFGFETVAKFDIFEYKDQQSLRDWDSAEIIEDLPSTFPDGNTLFIEDFNTLANGDIWDTANSEILYISEAGGPTDFTNTTLQDFLSISEEAVEIGSIKSIVITDPGRGYSKSPYYIVFEPRDYHMERYDYYIKYTKENELKAFRVGERITTTDGDQLAEARIVRHDPNRAEIYAVRLNVSTDVTDDTHIYTERDFRIGDSIIGEISGVGAVIMVVDETRMHNRVGLNTDVFAEAFSGVGFATDLTIINSGFGYFGKRIVEGNILDGEVLNLISEENGDRRIQAYGYLGKQGIGEGFWPSKKSFLSADKYLHDNDFYQEYSYQVLTALPFDKYKKTLVEILHVAGTKPFGGYVGTQEETVNVQASSDTSEYIIQQYGLFINENEFYSNTVVST